MYVRISRILVGFFSFFCFSPSKAKFARDFYMDDSLTRFVSLQNFDWLFAQPSHIEENAILKEDGQYRGWLAWGWWWGVVLFYKNSPLIGQKHAACIYTQLNIVHIAGCTIQFQQQSCHTVCLSCLTSILLSDESGTNPIPGFQFRQ